ncbi:MAG: tetratricopeptide repeat protein, partial [Deltaproteobacteria bacterium]|nr:tetratricopeptide repeat protein [Deltaproteobacteria bacterium]
MKTLIKLRTFIVILTGAAITVSCAGTPPKPPEKEPAQKPIEELVWVEREDRRLNAYTSYMISVYNRGSGRQKEAQEYLSRALEYDPEAPYLNLEMAVLLKEQGDYQGALKFARKGVDMDPEDIASRVLLADIYALSGKHDAAMAEYNKILELDPSQLRIKLIVTTMLIKREEYPQALEHLDAMLKEDPTLVIAHYYRGRV